MLFETCVTLWLIFRQGRQIFIRDHPFITTIFSKILPHDTHTCVCVKFCILTKQVISQGSNENKITLNISFYVFESNPSCRPFQKLQNNRFLNYDGCFEYHRVPYPNKSRLYEGIRSLQSYVLSVLFICDPLNLNRSSCLFIQ